MTEITDETLEELESQLGEDDGEEVTLFKTKDGKSYSIVTPQGKKIPFMQGRFWTSNPDDQEYLQGLANRRECGIIIDPDEPTIDIKNSTPELVARKRYRREIIAELKKANQAKRVNPGNSVQTKAVQHVGEEPVSASAGADVAKVSNPVASVVKAQTVTASPQEAVKAAIEKSKAESKG